MTTAIAKTETPFGIPAPLGSEAMLSSTESYASIEKKLTLMIKSGALPKNITNPMQAAIMIEHGARYGLTALESLQSIQVVMGKPSLSARAMGELILRHYGSDAFSILELTPELCRGTVRTKEGEVEVVYTIEQAKKSGLAGKPMWKQWPAEMLRAKWIRDVRHTYFPALGMIHETEILEDSRRDRDKKTVTLKDLG